MKDRFRVRPTYVILSYYKIHRHEIFYTAKSIIVQKGVLNLLLFVLWKIGRKKFLV